MALYPSSGKLYVSNTESPNLTRFEGPGVFGGSTVQGHVSEARISVIDLATGSVDPQHLNPHIDYSELVHGREPAAGRARRTTASRRRSRWRCPPRAPSTWRRTAPRRSACSARRRSRTPPSRRSTTRRRRARTTSRPAAVPAGLVLDETRGRLYVLTRFDNSVAVINPATKATLADPRAAQPRAGVDHRGAAVPLRRRADLGQRRGLVLELPHLRRHRQPRLGSRQSGRRRRRRTRSRIRATGRRPPSIR